MRRFDERLADHKKTFNLSITSSFLFFRKVVKMVEDYQLTKHKIYINDLPKNVLWNQHVTYQHELYQHVQHMRRQVHAGGVCEVLVHVGERAGGSQEIVHGLVQTFGVEPVLFGAQLCVQSCHCLLYTSRCV